MSSQFFQCTEHVLPGQHIRNYSRATAHSQNDVLRISVKQYCPLNYEPKEGDATILACPSNGFPKEVYEPLWDELLQQSKGIFGIRGIWVMDLVNQNQSAALNEGLLGNEPSWFDYSRDLLLVVNTFREQMPRPIVGFGHSLGACVMLHLSILHPRLLNTIVAVEATTHIRSKELEFDGTLPLVSKRDRWASRTDAEAYFRKIPFFNKILDQRVLELWLQHGLREQADGSVRLASSKHQESLSYARPCHPPFGKHLSEFQPDPERHWDLDKEHNNGNAFHRPEIELIFASLPHLRPSCFYLYGDKSKRLASVSDRANKLKTENTGIGQGGSGGGADKVKELRISGSHFLPLERPLAVAEQIGPWYALQLGRWAADEKQEREAWEAVDVNQRGDVPADSIQWMQALFGKAKL